MNSETPDPITPNGRDGNSVNRGYIWWYGHARRVVVFIVGMTVLLIGIIMIVAPGPATLVIPAGLAILATEFVWARKWLDYAKRQMQELAKNAAKFQNQGTDSGQK